MIFKPIIPIYALIILGALVIGLTVFCIINRNHRKMSNFIRLGISILLILAMLRPMVPFKAKNEEARTNIVLYFVVDNTGSMAVKDEGGIAREDALKQDMQDIINSFEAPRVAIFAQDAVTYRMMPATSDVKTALSLAENLHAKATLSSEGTDLKKLFTEASNYMNNYLESDKDAEFIVFLMSDGEDAINGSTEYNIEDGSFEKATYGAVIGYGSAKGGQVPNIIEDYSGGIITYRKNKDIPYILGKDGQEVVSSMNEGYLKSVAKSYNFTYAKAGDIKSLVETAKGKVGNKLVFEEVVDSTTAFELYWIFMLFTCVLLLIEFARDFNGILAEREAKK